jgi:FMN phosphatase YigB (HAD superfamily)
MQAIEAIVFEPTGCFAEAVAGAEIYEDVIPALGELKSMGIQLSLAPSVSEAAAECFLEERGLRDFFSRICRVRPENTIYVTATAEGLQRARSLGVRAVLMMNDPDEAMRLTAQNPAGGIVSLRELPDFVRLVAARAA